MNAATQKRTNFFVDSAGIAQKDTGHVTAGGKRLRVSGGMMFWKAIKDGCWKRVQKLNAARIAQWRGTPPPEPDTEDEIQY